LDTDQIIASTAREIKTNPPAILAKTERKFGAGAAERQRKAILLNKSRRAGARIAKPKSMGGA